MGKVESALRDEIVRLAKKVARDLQAKTVDEVRRLKARVAALQAELAALKRERASEQARQRMASAAESVPEEAASKIRMSPVLVKKLRKRLNVTQPQLAALLGVSNAAVGFWEGGKSQPRPSMKAKLAALRKLGRRDAHRLLKEMASKTKPKPRKKRRPAKKTRKK